MSLALFSMAAALLGWAPPAAADGTETLGPPSLTLAQGSGVATGATGMHNQPASMTVNVPAGATVKQVLLYWEGHYNTGGPDDDIVIEGQAVTGTLIGGPTLFFGDVYATTYRADITSLGLVGAGANTLDVSGLEFTFRNNGAGVLVIYDDGDDTVIGLRDGSDLAFVNFDSPLDTTVPQTFTFAASPTDRVATLDLFAASVADGQDRPNAVDVTVAGTTTRFTDVFSSNAGPEFDVTRHTVDVPAGATSLTVQALSVGDGSQNLPASFDWVVATLTIQKPPEGPEPGATAAVVCTEGVIKVTLTNSGGTGTTFDVFRGEEKLNPQPIAVGPGGSQVFTYQLRPGDENTTVPLRATAGTEETFVLATPVDCGKAGLVATLAGCVTQDGVKGVSVTLTNDGTDAGTFTVPGVGEVAVAAKSSKDVFLPVAEGAAYSIEITGTGGYKTTFAGTRDCQAPELGPLQVCATDGTGVIVTIANSGKEDAPVTLGSETKTVPAGGKAEFFVKRTEDEPATTLTATSPGNAALAVALPLHDCVGVSPVSVLAQVDTTTTTTTTTTIAPQVAGTQLARTGFGFGDVLRLGLWLIAAGALLVAATRRFRRPQEG